MRNKKLYVTLFAAFVGLGMSMPSCPGQQAMQQQIDTLTTQHGDLIHRAQNLDVRVKKIEETEATEEKLLQSLSEAVQSQKAGMDQLNANLHDIQAKLAAPPAKGKKRRR